MGVLDNVFAGEKGVVAVLASKLGGTATLIYFGETVYNEESDDETQTTKTREVAILPEDASRAVSESSIPASESGGLLTDAIDFAGTIPAFGATKPIPNVDRILYNGVNYAITSVVANFVGDSVVAYRLLGKRI